MRHCRWTILEPVRPLGWSIPSLPPAVVIAQEEPPSGGDSPHATRAGSHEEVAAISKNTTAMLTNVKGSVALIPTSIEGISQVTVASAGHDLLDRHLQHFVAVALPKAQ